jgi:O-antigen/teichoic acid export membrane protein
VLIALDRQKALTVAFGFAVAFNMIANLIFLPVYSYRAAAIITILSEIVLLIMTFTWVIRRELGSMGWPAALWRPVVAALVLFGALLLIWQVAPLGGLLLSPLIYGVTLLALRPFGKEEMMRIAPLLPGRMRRWAQRGEIVG